MLSKIKNFVGVLLVAGAAAVPTAASALNVSFVVTWAGGTYGTGSFAGSDTNSNGRLEFSELSSFAFVSPGFGHNLNLGSLVDTGDYQISSNTWIPNGISWVGNPDDAFFTWNARSSSVNSTWATVETQADNAVPEPGTLAIVGLGLGVLGFATRRRRH